MSASAAGFLLGLAGSAHCAVMCGPLALALYRGPGSRGRWLFALHHAGRLSMYAVAGLVAGGAGRAAGLAGLGRILAVAVGVALAAGAVGRLRSGASVDAGAAAGRLWSRTASLVTRRIGQRPRVRALALGAINGLLPCGMVYAALGASMALGDAGRAMLFMVAFGLGAVPALVLVHVAGPFVARVRWRHAGLVTRLALFVLGGSLVLHGLRAGSPVQGAGGVGAAPHHHHRAP